MRAAIFGVLVAGVMVYAPAQNARFRFAEFLQNCPEPGAKVDLAFIIDRSGSFDMNLVGQAYNVQIEGVLRALRDKSVIPRDGSVAVTVETFAGIGTIQVPFKQIDTAADAEAIAAMVESLRCTATNCTPAGLCPVFGSNPASNYAPAITTASNHLNQNHRPGARQALLLSSDGLPSDLPKAAPTAKQVGDDATTLGVQFELDLILLARQAQSCIDIGAEIKQIVYPQPACELPGAVLPIGGDSNKPCASLDDSAVKADHDRQVKEFAELTRRVLRSQPATRFLTVNTDADTDPDAPAIGSTLSLRQAIERANNNCGATTITFDPGLKDKTIRPLIPLPALRAPDIIIDGCDGQNCTNSVTIAGPPDTTKGEQHNDGLLIRSNHDVVRGLRIINFTRAGIAIDPVWQSDIVGHNRIERNTLEDNKVAGVLVEDLPSTGSGGHGGVRPNPVVHNIGNTILGNTILDSLDCATPIDLGGEGLTAGRTDNDLCDTDEGPNTLLNFPRIITVTQSAGSVTVTGSVCDPNCAEEVCPSNLIGAVVEIFAITRFGTNCGAVRSSNGVTDLQVDLDNRVITGVMPLATGTTDADGSFTISGVGVSPTCGYTATVTDLAGNTSELMFSCAGFAKANIDTIAISFSPDLVPNGTPLSAQFQVENQGCAPLSVASFSFTRDGFGGHKKGRDDDGPHFSIKPPIVGPNGITIAPGQVQGFTVEFDPAIPRCLLSGEKLRAADTLPSTIMSSLTLNHNGCGAPTSTIKLIARVTTEVHLIDAQNPQKLPRVTLTRSGDELFASFAVFDSNRDVQKAMYELLDSAGRTVPLDNCCVDLTGIQNKYVAGQSFSVFQEFSNASNHPEVAAIRVTVFDKDGTSDTATSSQIAISKRTASAQSLGHKQTSSLILSSTKAAPVFRKRASR